MTLALQALATCERLPPLAPDLANADMLPPECAEAALSEPVKAFSSAAPDLRQGARALMAASRIARVDIPFGTFDPLHDQPSTDAASLLKPWTDFLSALDDEAIAAAEGAPPEIAAKVHFIVARAWMDFRHRVGEVLMSNVMDKVPAVLQPVDAHVVDLVRAALAIGQRGSVLVRRRWDDKTMTEDAYPAIAIDPTHALDFGYAPVSNSTGTLHDAEVVANRFPSWATHLFLAQAEPKWLARPTVLEELAAANGVPLALRTQLEADAKPLVEEARTAIAFSEAKVALAYDSPSDCAAAVSSFKPKKPRGRFIVGVCKAFLRDGAPLYTTDLTELDLIAKMSDPFTRLDLASAFDAALLSVAALRTGPKTPSDPAMTIAQKKARDDAMLRLEVVQQLELDVLRDRQARDLLTKLRAESTSSGG